MTLQSKKHKNSSTEGTSRDRFSELPDNVIVHILSFLPISDAVKTVLLRCCGNLWTMVPSLHFSDYFYELHFFLNFVRNVLLFHKRPTIDEFHLEMSVNIPEIETWTQFALSREAKVLKLHIDCLCRFSEPNELCTLPRCILVNQTLVSLEIRGCNIEQQSQVHMGSLRKLVLDEVCFGDKMFEQIVSGCPSLEELLICFLYHNPSLCIMSTNIKFLKLEGSLSGTIDCPYLRTLHISYDTCGFEIIDVRSLSELEVDCFGDPSEINAPLFLLLLEKVGHVEVVKLTHSTLDMLADCSMRVLARRNNSWKHLILNAPINTVIILAIFELVRNSPSLEELTVYADLNYRRPPMMQRLDNNMFVQELSTPCVMSKLKIVTIHEIVYAKDQLPLVEFLLKNAVNMEKLVFVSKSKERLEFVKHVASFRRASSNATVVFARK